MLDVAYNLAVLWAGVNLISAGWLLFSFALWGAFEVLNRTAVWLFTRRLEVAHD